MVPCFLETSTLPSCPHLPIPDLLGQQLQAASGTGPLQLLTFLQCLLQPTQALSQGPIQLLLALFCAPLSVFLSLAARGVQHFCRGGGILLTLFFCVWIYVLLHVHMFAQVCAQVYRLCVE